MIDAAFEDLDQLKRVHGADPRRRRVRRQVPPPARPPARRRRRTARRLSTRTSSPRSSATSRSSSSPSSPTPPATSKSGSQQDGVADVDRIDGTRGNDRYAMIKRFAPFYNKVSADDRKKLAPLRVLVSTDVLSEGVNLQDGTLLVNYDIHWNPVRLMQRIGRVDRRMNPAIEAELVKEKPSAKKSRGHIQIRNFLPPAEIETLLTPLQPRAQQDPHDLQHPRHPRWQAHRRVRHVRRREGLPGLQGRVRRRHRPHRGVAAEVAQPRRRRTQAWTSSSSACPTASRPPRTASRRASSSAAASRFSPR